MKEKRLKLALCSLSNQIVFWSTTSSSTVVIARKNWSGFCSFTRFNSRTFHSPTHPPIHPSILSGLALMQLDVFITIVYNSASGVLLPIEKNCMLCSTYCGNEQKDSKGKKIIVFSEGEGGASAEKREISGCLRLRRHSDCSMMFQILLHQPLSQAEVFQGSCGCYDITICIHFLCFLNFLSRSPSESYRKQV